MWVRVPKDAPRVNERPLDLPTLELSRTGSMLQEWLYQGRQPRNFEVDC